MGPESPVSLLAQALCEFLNAQFFILLLPPLAVPFFAELPVPLFSLQSLTGAPVLGGCNAVLVAESREAWEMGLCAWAAVLGAAVTIKSAIATRDFGLGAASGLGAFVRGAVDGPRLGDVRTRVFGWVLAARHGASVAGAESAAGADLSGAKAPYCGTLVVDAEARV